VVLTAGVAQNSYAADWAGPAGRATLPDHKEKMKKGGPTNAVVGVLNGIQQRRLGSSDLVVSEVALGTQRWVSSDFNAPDEQTCHLMLDYAVANGVNLIDTAEQYPIPSDRAHPEGLVEEVIGKWMQQGKGRREKVVIATKITGGGRITGKGIAEACDGSLKRLGTDYIDLYQFHWPARYTLACCIYSAGADADAVNLLFEFRAHGRARHTTSFSRARH
jgi:aryl-alcohol dehydrogenase-like predicted oxidoreductase